MYHHTQHNGIQYGDAQNNDVQHDNFKKSTLSITTLHRNIIYTEWELVDILAAKLVVQQSSAKTGAL